MQRTIGFRHLARITLCGTALLALLAPVARAGNPAMLGSPCPPPFPTAAVASAPATPQMPSTPQVPTPPAKKDDTTPPAKKDDTAPPAVATPPATDQSSLAQAPESGAPLGGEGVSLASSNVGYIDSAIPRTEYRLRFDAAYHNNRPDRAEFFYAKCGCFKTAGLDPNASGPPLPEKRVDYQEIHNYIEYAATSNISGFVNIPVRFINPEVNANETGLGDIDFGFKAALIADSDRYFTFQFKTYSPSGDAFKGLGNDHWTVEPGFLLYQKLSDRLTFEAELRDWIPLGGSEFAGNVLRYGAGVSYQALQTCDWNLGPVVEVVGWTVLGGKEFDATTGGIYDADGDTIVNLKLGARLNYGEHISLYGGYGRALTGAVWYKDLARVELRLNF